jgi:hypothetical protein
MSQKLLSIARQLPSSNLLALSDITHVPYYEGIILSPDFASLGLEFNGTELSATNYNIPVYNNNKKVSALGS